MIKKTKFTKESRNFLIALLIGDGTIMRNKYSNSMKVQHGRFQKEYLEWKIKKMNELAIDNSGLRTYSQITNYSHGEIWNTYAVFIKHYTFIDVLRKVVYTENGKVLSRKLLNRLNPLGLAVWYMDDGGLNHKKKINRLGQKVIYSTTLRISVCTRSTEVIQSYIDYFKEVWDINFYTFKEGKNKDMYSLMCGTNEARKFLDIVKPYIDEIPSMSYKGDLMIGHVCDCTPIGGNGGHLNSEDIV